jgi:hypothetical protein
VNNHQFEILRTPSPQGIHIAAQWLAHHSEKNPDLELALNFLLKNQIIPHERGG